MTKTIFGLFRKKTEAETAVNELMDYGVEPEEISMITKEDIVHAEVGEEKNVAKDIMSGAVAGGAVGGLGGLLVGVSAISIPGIGAFLIGGPIATALGLSGAGVIAASGALTGALAGGLVGSLIGLGIPRDVATTIESDLEKGTILLGTPTNEKNQEDLMEILDSNNAHEIFTTSVADETTPKHTHYRMHGQT